MFDTITVKPKGTSRTLIVGHFSGQPLDTRSKAAVSAVGALDVVTAALSRPEATGDAGAVCEAFPDGKKASADRVIIVGLGKAATFELGSLRFAAASAARRLAGAKATSATFELAGPVASIKGDMTVAGQMVGEAVGLLGWVCDDFKGKGSNTPKRLKLELRSSDTDFANGMDRGLALAESTNFARTLSQTPPNIATTSFMAKAAMTLARKTGMSCKIFEGDALERERLTGHINVGKASENAPCMIRLEYAPKGVSKTSKPLVLIGKTICYDTGGLSLKINNGMVGMKRDKDGGCAVLGAMHAIATLVKPRKRVVAFLVAAENSISDEAYRPDDVLTYRNGVTVEVTNTDAEGRLVLADALCFACEKENPAAIVDIATLTGGVVTALGSTFAGMWCENDKLRAQVEEAAKASGERIWRLPMHQEYRDMMKSPVADIVNSNPNRKAHPIQGAAFLSYFVEDRIPWCHLDIAGVHATEKNSGMFIDGPTGWGVRLMAALAE